jgi:hypothetical protein
MKPQSHDRAVNRVRTATHQGDYSMRGRLNCCSVTSALRTAHRLALAGVVAAALALSAGSVTAQSTISSYLRAVVSHHAPIIIAEIDAFSPNPEAVDHILKVDFDGNTMGADNAADADNGVVIDGKSTAYYSIVETGATTEKGYFFINFYFYHARDAGVHFSSPAGTFTGNGAHEHDLEGVMLIVRKSFTAPYGTLVGAYTEAHGALIPYSNPTSSPTLINPAGAGLGGTIRFWNEAVFNVDRPVVAIRSRKHGTYMAQDCSGKSPLPDVQGGFAYGMWLGSPQELGVYKACIHNDGDFITYVPVPLDANAASTGAGAARLGPLVRHGTKWYQLIELVTSPIWQNRTSPALFYNPLMTLSGGLTGYGTFRGSIVGVVPSANTPWDWQGGVGECINIWVKDACWYSYGSDNTQYYLTPKHWPTAPANGQLLTNPGAELALRFPGTPYTAEPFRYNPYVSNASPCCAAYLLSAAMTGPTDLSIQEPGTWTAVAAGGTPPYTYKWTGAFTATAQSVSGAVGYSRPLFLDVTDAAGAHVAVSTFISVTDPNPPPCGNGVAC